MSSSKRPMPLSFPNSSSFLCLFLVCFAPLVCFAQPSNKASSSNVPTKIGNGYRLISLEEAPNGGIVGYLQVKNKNEVYGSDIPSLRLYIKHETGNRLRVHITDSDKPRWEVPYNLLPREQPPPLKQSIARSRKIPLSTSKIPGDELIFSYTPDPFTFSVKRKSNGQTLFDTASDEQDPYNSLVFKDQYLEISTKLPSDASLYGFGENTQPHGSHPCFTC